MRQLSLLVACCLSILYGVANAQDPGQLRVLRYNTDDPVDQFVVYGRFLRGDQLRGLNEMLGVPEDSLDLESDDAAKELFIFLRIEATEKANGVPFWVELTITNDSPVIAPHERVVKVPALFAGRHFVVQKLVSQNDSRNGYSGAYGAPEPPSDDNTDYVEKLSHERPVLRLKSMVTK